MAIVYPVQFDNDPCDDLLIDKVIARVVKTGAMNAVPEKFLEAIRAALSSDERLSDITMQPYRIFPETLIRST